jgi:hypothetical protein
VKYFLSGFLLISCLAFASEAFSSPVQWEAVTVSPGRYTTSGFATPITTKISSAGVSSYKQIVPVLSKSSLTNVVKTGLKGGLPSLAIAGAIGGLGYLIDQATLDIKKTEIVTSSEIHSGGYDFNNGSPRFPTPQGACQNLASTWPGETYDVYQHSSSPLVFNCRIYRASGALKSTQTLVGYGQVIPGSTEEQFIDLSPSDWSIIENTLSSNLSASDKNRILSYVLRNTSISGSADTSDYPASISSSNSDTDQLYQDWPELKSSIDDLVNSKLSELLKEESPEHELTAEEQALADSLTDAPPPETQTELSLEAPTMFRDTVVSWWVPLYPDGISGIFSNFIQGVTNGPFIAMLNPLKSLPDNGIAPVWSINFDIGSMGNYGTQTIDLPAGVWAFIRFCILFTAVMMVRKLIFGG